MNSILLVDDEKKICEFVKAYLDKEGYNVDVAYNGKECIYYLERKEYSLIILDRMLPDISGEKICKFVRCEYIEPQIPIIMLTAKIEDEDRIEGFNLGCDDYICKPFNVKELVLRVKAVLKRTKFTKKEVLKFNDEIEIDTESRSVKVRGRDVFLTNTEYKLLLIMASNPKRVFTREELLQNVVEDPCQKFDRVIDSHIKNLRQKIEVNSKDFKIVKTVYGVGYKFGI